MRQRQSVIRSLEAVTGALIGILTACGVSESEGERALPEAPMLPDRVARVRAAAPVVAARELPVPESAVRQLDRDRSENDWIAAGQLRRQPSKFRGAELVTPM